MGYQPQDRPKPDLEWPLVYRTMAVLLTFWLVVYVVLLLACAEGPNPPWPAVDAGVDAGRQDLAQRVDQQPWRCETCDPWRRDECKQPLICGFSGNETAFCCLPGLGLLK